MGLVATAGPFMRPFSCAPSHRSGFKRRREGDGFGDFAVGAVAIKWGGEGAPCREGFTRWVAQG